MTTVLFVTRKWPPAVGGMETYCKELVDELQKTDIGIDLRALPGRQDGRTPSAFSIIVFGLRTAVSLLLTKKDWDVAHGGDMAVWPLAIIPNLRNRGAHTVLSAHGTDVALAKRSGPAASAYRAYLKTCARIASRRNLVVAANSDATAAMARSLGFTDVRVVPLASRPLPPEGPVPEGRFILFVGRLQIRKGLSWFVEMVLPALPEDVKLVVAGPKWDAEESGALSDPRVDYLGSVSQRRLAALAGAAQAVIIPNMPGPARFEGFGLVAVEAAVAGGLVLASDLDGFRNSVIDGKTGRLLPPGEPDAWISALSDILALDDDTRQALRDKAKSVALEHFSWERVAVDTMALYHEAIGPRKR